MSWWYLYFEKHPNGLKNIICSKFLRWFRTSDSILFFRWLRIVKNMM